MVALTCSNTEIVSALGCADRLVGVDDHSDFPSEVVATLPRVGPDLSIDVEQVAALEPDLVLASLTVPGHEKVIERLEAAGLPFIAPRPQSLVDVYRDIEQIAALLDVKIAGQELVADMRRRLAVSSADGVGSRPYRPKIAVQWWPKPVILPGQKSWVHDLIELAGGENLIGGDPVESRPVTDEELQSLAPDVIVLSWCGVEERKYRPDVIYNNALWQDVPAVRNRRVVSITEAYLGRPSPRLVQGFEALRRAVQEAGTGSSTAGSPAVGPSPELGKYA